MLVHCTWKHETSTRRDLAGGAAVVDDVIVFQGKEEESSFVLEEVEESA